MTTTGTTLFDRHVAVDWSASSKPNTGADSIWLCDRQSATQSTRRSTLLNPPTRADAAQIMASIVNETAESGGRTLIGVDVSFATPSGLAGALGLPTENGWLEIWRTIAALTTDGPRNQNNRFEVGATLNRRISPEGDPAGPFWGRPARSDYEDLQATRGSFPHLVSDGSALAEFRHCEKLLLEQGLRPQSTWKLAYQASVGGQFLTAVPILLRIRENHPQWVRIWPFDTGFVDSSESGRPLNGQTWFAEAWPGAFWTAGQATSGMVKDAEQVTAVVDSVAGADIEGTLADWLAEPFCEGPALSQILNEEGWVLAPTRPPSVKRSTANERNLPVRAGPRS